MQKDDYKTFYDDRRDAMYGLNPQAVKPEQHSYFKPLTDFIATYGLQDKKCLEIGSHEGHFQDMVKDYYGTDIATTLAKYYHKPFRVVEGEKYPFDDGMFDAIWSMDVFEHIPHLQSAMLEVVRLLKPGGVLLFAPAWQCRPWAAEGFAVRPYRDFGFAGKCIKASLPVRNSLVWRSLFVIPKRLWRHTRFALGHRYAAIHYKKLTPNYEHYWTADSDACNHIDPHDALLWFRSHGVDCLSHSTVSRALTVRNGPLIFRKRTR